MIMILIMTVFDYQYKGERQGEKTGFGEKH